jgi:hypothetical protein
MTKAAQKSTVTGVLRFDLRTLANQVRTSKAAMGPRLSFATSARDGIGGSAIGAG